MNPESILIWAVFIWAFQARASARRRSSGAGSPPVKGRSWASLSLAWLGCLYSLICASLTADQKSPFCDDARFVSLRIFVSWTNPGTAGPFPN